MSAAVAKMFVENKTAVMALPLHTLDRESSELQRLGAF